MVGDGFFSLKFSSIQVLICITIKQNLNSIKLGDGFFFFQLKLVLSQEHWHWVPFNFKSLLANVIGVEICQAWSNIHSLFYVR